MHAHKCQNPCLTNLSVLTIGSSSMSYSLEEIHVCEFLHLINICSLDNFLVVEQNPSVCAIPRNVLADERNVVSI